MARAEGIKQRQGNRASRWALLASTVLVGVAAMPVEAAAQQKTSRVSTQDKAVGFSIPAQPLPDALDAFIRATGWQVGYSANALAGKRSQAVSGHMAPAAALRRLIAGSGLSLRMTGPTTAALVDPQATGTIDGSADDGATALEVVEVDGIDRKSVV